MAEFCHDRCFAALARHVFESGVTKSHNEYVAAGIKSAVTTEPAWHPQRRTEWAGSKTITGYCRLAGDIARRNCRRHLILPPERRRFEFRVCGFLLEVSDA